MATTTTLAVAISGLTQLQACSTGPFRYGLDSKHIIDVGGRQKIDGHGAHRKGNSVLGQFAVMDALHPQELGSRPLEEFKIRRMVDIARKIGVLVVDANRKSVGLAGHDTLLALASWDRGAQGIQRPILLGLMHHDVLDFVRRAYQSFVKPKDAIVSFT